MTTHDPATVRDNAITATFDEIRRNEAPFYSTATIVGDVTSSTAGMDSDGNDNLPGDAPPSPPLVAGVREGPDLLAVDNFELIDDDNERGVAGVIRIVVTPAL